MGDDFIGDAHLVQLFTQPLDGLILVVGELRMLVEIPPHLDHIGLYRFCKLIHFHGNSPPGSLPAAGTGSLPLRQNLTFCKGPRAISPGTCYIHFTLSPRKLQDGKDNLYLLYQNDGDFFADYTEKVEPSLSLSSRAENHSRANRTKRRTAGGASCRSRTASASSWYTGGSMGARTTCPG